MTNQTSPGDGKTKQHIVKSVEPLSDEYFDDLVAELDSDEIVGIILGEVMHATKQPRLAT
jgi:hypothetical protein